MWSCYRWLSNNRFFFIGVSSYNVSPWRLCHLKNLLQTVWKQCSVSGQYRATVITATDDMELHPKHSPAPLTGQIISRCDCWPQVKTFPSHDGDVGPTGYDKHPILDVACHWHQHLFEISHPCGCVLLKKGCSFLGKMGGECVKN